MTATAHDERLQLSRRALLFFIYGTVAIAEAPTVIFANEIWYRERPEREQELAGTLARTQPSRGPNARSALRYSFESNSQTFLVYAPRATEQLDRFIGARTIVIGKVVDLGSDGFGQELWIGSIRRS